MPTQFIVIYYRNFFAKACIDGPSRFSTACLTEFLYKFLETRPAHLVKGEPQTIRTISTSRTSTTRHRSVSFAKTMEVEMFANVIPIVPWLPNSSRLSLMSMAVVTWILGTWSFLVSLTHHKVLKSKKCNLGKSQREHWDWFFEVLKKA